MSKRIAGGDVYMIDTQRLTEKDRMFAEWRHNGSEYLFWESRKQQKQQLLESQKEIIVSSDSNFDSDVDLTNPNKPYILRFVTNGMSAHNFGHVNHDVLWPFIVSYNLHHLFSKRPNAPIYVIDIGVFLVKFLQLAYPERQFVGFRSIDEIPIDCEEILISGLGAPKYFDVNVIKYDEMNEVRKHMLKICQNYIQLNKLQFSLPIISLQQINPFEWSKFNEINKLENRNDQQAQNNENILKIIFIERNITQVFKEKNDKRYDLDNEQDHPALRYYYDSGYWSHTVLTSKRILGSDRRNILDFENVIQKFTDSFQKIYSNYYKKYHQQRNNNNNNKKNNKYFDKTKVEIIRFNPELYHYCEQVQIISTGNVSDFFFTLSLFTNLLIYLLNRLLLVNMVLQCH